MSKDLKFRQAEIDWIQDDREFLHRLEIEIPIKCDVQQGISQVHIPASAARDVCCPGHSMMIWPITSCASGVEKSVNAKVIIRDGYWFKGAVCVSKGSIHTL